MINVIQSYMLEDAVVEKEVHEAREKVKVELTRQLHGIKTAPSSKDAEALGQLPEIVYDENGRPRPRLMAYDTPHSDVPLRVVPDVEPPLDDEDEEDVVNPFPNLYPPLG